MRVAVIPAILLLAFAGCGTSNQRAAVPGDPCSLLPIGEAQQIEGLPLSEAPLPPAAKRRPVQECLYMGGPFDLTHLAPGQEVKSASITLRVISTGDASKFISTERNHAPKGWTVEPVRGVGDEAVWVNDGMLVAAVRGVRVEVTVVDAEGPSKAKATEVVSRVSSRIGNP